MLLGGEYCVGVFDSGLGGITVLRQLQRKYPWCNYIYFADSAHCPYGIKSPHYVLQRANAVIDYLQRAGADAVVAACNTASVHLDELRKRAPVDVYGVIKPTCAAAVQATRNRRIALLATDATVNSGEYQRMIAACDVCVRAIKCSALVPFAEQCLTNSTQCRLAADNLLHNLARYNCDTVILGCTHFPLLLGVLKPYFNGAQIIRCTTDFVPSPIVAPAKRGTTTYLTSGDALSVNECARHLAKINFAHANV